MKHIDGDTPVIATEADIILKKVIAQARKAGIPVSDNIDKNIVISITLFRVSISIYIFLCDVFIVC